MPPRLALAVVAIIGLAPAALRAQAQATLADQREAMVDLTLRGMRGRILLDSIAVWTVVPQPPAAALADARAVLDSLKVPVSHTTTRAVYDNNMVARGTLANERLSLFLDCGSGMTGAHADEWRVAMGYAVFVAPAAAGGTRLGVAIAGSASDNSGAAKALVPCASTGRFEQMVAALIAARK